MPCRHRCFWRGECLGEAYEIGAALAIWEIGWILMNGTIRLVDVTHGKMIIMVCMLIPIEALENAHLGIYRYILITQMLYCTLILFSFCDSVRCEIYRAQSAHTERYWCSSSSTRCVWMSFCMEVVPDLTGPTRRTKYGSSVEILVLLSSCLPLLTAAIFSCCRVELVLLVDASIVTTLGAVTISIFDQLKFVKMKEDIMIPLSTQVFFYKGFWTLVIVLLQLIMSICSMWRFFITTHEATGAIDPPTFFPVYIPRGPVGSFADQRG